MSDIRFGYCLPVFANPGPNLFRTPGYAELDAKISMDLGRLADELGYDSLWVADHLMLGKNDAILEGWTVLSALAGSTQQSKLGLIHQAHFFRQPALAAKMAATLDQISAGRLIHFYDAGHARREYVAYGLPWSDDADERVARMEEGLKLTVALWTSSEPLHFQGSYYDVAGAVCNPVPLQQPHPPIWLGGTHPDILRACAGYAQGWNTTPVSILDLRRSLRLLSETCEVVGRPYSELEKSLEIQILVASDTSSVRRHLRDMLTLTSSETPTYPGLQEFIDGEIDQPPEQLRSTTIIGTPLEVQHQIRAYIDEGIDHFMLWFLDAPSDEGLRLFAEEVVPAFRD